MALHAETARQLPFTLDTAPRLGTDPIPTGVEGINFEQEQQNLSYMSGKIGFEYRIAGAQTLSRIQYWLDDTSRKDSVMRLAYSEFIRGVDTKRDPTVAELVKFYRIAQYKFPDDELTQRLAIEVSARIETEAIATLERSRQLQRLLVTLNSVDSCEA